MFIRIHLIDDDRNEWGGNSEWVPSVGDTLVLYYEKPDEEPEGNDLYATVVERQFCLEDPDEIWIKARSSSAVPAGYVADSPTWPSKSWSLREMEMSRILEAMRR